MCILYRVTSSSSFWWRTPVQPTTTVNTTALTAKLPTRTHHRLRNPRRRWAFGWIRPRRACVCDDDDKLKCLMIYWWIIQLPTSSFRDFLSSCPRNEAKYQNDKSALSTKYNVGAQTLKSCLYFICYDSGPVFPNHVNVEHTLVYKARVSWVKLLLFKRSFKMLCVFY